MRTILPKYVLFAVLITISVNLSSCSDDEGQFEPVTLPANAKGVSIKFYPSYSDGNDDNFYEDELYYWINSYVIKDVSPYNDLEIMKREYENGFPEYLAYNAAYHDFSLSLFYEYLNNEFQESFGDYPQYKDIKITESYDITSLPVGAEEAIAAVKWINKYKYQYKNAAIHAGRFYLFNRTSDENY